MNVEPDIQAVLAAQRNAIFADGYASADIRRDRLRRLACAVLRHERELVDSLQIDYGNRSPFTSRAFDILGTVSAIEYHLEYVERWMQPQRLELPREVEARGTTAELCFQPRGVLGAIIPWNGPVLMGCLAAMGGISAGNRVMLKMSELTPETGIAFGRAIESEFDPTEVAVINGDALVAAEFASQRFDHLLFTGSTATGRKVAEAAAKNLVPVTLELGGKSPVIIGENSDLSMVANRLVSGKLSSAGQVCVSPDYVLVPAGKAEDLVTECVRAAKTLFPDMMRSQDYTCLINGEANARMQRLLRDAASKGAELTFVPQDFTLEDLPSEGRFPFVMITSSNMTMGIMQEEIFGPLLPIMEYHSPDEVMETISRSPDPLSAYYFGEDESEASFYASAVRTGSFVINDVRIQLAFEALPFGGVGSSGSGRYRGKAGFVAFSNCKPVLHQRASEQELAATRPPFSPAAHDYLEKTLARKKSEYDIEPQSGTGKPLPTINAEKRGQ